jgi:Arc/MetJ family transcription regulator
MATCVSQRETVGNGLKRTVRSRISASFTGRADENDSAKQLILIVRSLSAAV